MTLPNNAQTLLLEDGRSVNVGDLVDIPGYCEKATITRWDDEIIALRLVGGIPAMLSRKWVHHIRVVPINRRVD